MKDAAVKIMLWGGGGGPWPSAEAEEGPHALRDLDDPPREGGGPAQSGPAPPEVHSGPGRPQSDRGALLLLLQKR